MREIEFRWKTPFGWKYWNTEKDYSLWIWLNRETLCQYIGLMDKNGKKIYEGDVVCVIVDQDFKLTGVVKFRDKDAAFGLRCSEDPADDYLPLLAEFDVEVLGNVFDDPVLKEKYLKLWNEEDK